jgi:hypothetical protein
MHDRMLTAPPLAPLLCPLFQTFQAYAASQIGADEKAMQLPSVIQGDYHERILIYPHFYFFFFF